MLLLFSGKSSIEFLIELVFLCASYSSVVNDLYIAVTILFTRTISIKHTYA